MNSWFANISVNLKLGLGFGLVLVLTALLALTGWNSLGSLIQRSNWMSDITRLNSDLTNLRVARLQYMLANGDDATANNVQVKLNEFNQQQQMLLKTFKSPENLKLLNEQAQIIAAYQVTLDRMRATYKASAAARADLETTAAAALQLIDNINRDVLGQGDSDAARLEQYRAASAAKEQLLQVRFEVRGYIADNSTQSEQTALRQLDNALDYARQLGQTLPNEAARIQQFQAAVTSYRDALNRYKGAVADIAAARAEMTKQGYDIVERSEALYKIQLERRDAESAQARSLQLIATLLALLVGIAAALIITRQITRPLRETMAVVERIAAGDLTHEQRVSRRDELGVLQQGIQRMGTTLRELISGIRDGVTQIASAAEELSAVTEQTSAGANNQKSETDQVATAMHEMATTVQEVARNAEHASEAATDADRQARAGDEVVSQAIAQIEKLAGEVQRSTEAMAELQKESQKIGSVMDVIKSVAEQTNLLALNAAIEAARAGEAGVGSRWSPTRYVDWRNGRRSPPKRSKNWSPACRAAPSRSPISCSAAAA